MYDDPENSPVMQTATVNGLKVRPPTKKPPAARGWRALRR